MSNPYNTDGILVYPDLGKQEITRNALENIECTIAFDVKCWDQADRRSAWIHTIVFGVPEDEDENDDGWHFSDTMKEYGWDEEDKQRAIKYHEQWKKAKALLKEQEARLMTLDEVKAFDWDYCYLEEERLPGKVYRAVCGEYALTCITWPCVSSMRIQHGDDSYGKKWRCWSSKPTDEQRQAVKWDA